MTEGDVDDEGKKQSMNEKGLNVSPFAIRRLALRGAANSKGRSAVGVRGDSI